MKVSFFILVLIMMLTTVQPVQVASAASQAAANKQQAVEIAQQQFSGRVLSVKREGDSYRVKILNSNGDIRIIKVIALNANQSQGRRSSPDRP